MKIAIPTDDGITVSRHFGRAAQYVVITVENGTVVDRELRAKFSPHGAGGEGHKDEPGLPHGTGAEADAKHDQMVASIADCSAVLCGGMGRGAYDRLSAVGIPPIVTDIEDADEAALAFAGGTIVNHLEALH